MSEKTVEHISGGEVREFSAIKGQGKAGKAPVAHNYEDKAAIVGINHKKDDNKGE